MAADEAIALAVTEPINGTVTGISNACDCPVASALLWQTTVGACSTQPLGNVARCTGAEKVTTNVAVVLTDDALSLTVA